MKKKCLRCGKEFIKLWRHLHIKTECEVQYLIIPRDKMLDNYDEYYKQFIEYNYKNGIFKCKHCDKKYSSKNAYYRHKRYKHKKINNISNISINNSNNNNNNNNNNTLNIDNTQNNINISINGFGNEKLLSKKDITKILKEPINKIISEYVKQTYINTLENRCIQLSNLRCNYAKVYIDGQWEHQLVIPLVDKIIDKSSSHIIGHLGECNRKLIEVDGIQFEDPVRKKKCDLQNYLYGIHDDPSKRRIVRDEIKLIFRTNCDKIKCEPDQLVENSKFIVM